MNSNDELFWFGLLCFSWVHDFIDERTVLFVKMGPVSPIQSTFLSRLFDKDLLFVFFAKKTFNYGI